MFDPFLNELNEVLISEKGQTIELPDGLGHCASPKGDALIRSWLWDVPGFRRWRITRMDAGDKLQVFNSVAYPKFNNECPIMGIDLLWFGVKKKLVAVLDFQPLVQEKSYFDKYYKDLKLLKSNFLDFNNKNTRIYDLNKFFSPWVLFCRGGHEEAQSSLPLVFTNFLQSYLKLISHGESNSCEMKSNKIKDLHILYDIYSADKDPAHGLFKSYFGKQWSDRFLTEFLFPHSKSRTSFEV